jgi:hypothetical protein
VFVDEDPVRARAPAEPHMQISATTVSALVC